MATGAAMKVAINATIHGANIMTPSPSPSYQAYACPHALSRIRPSQIGLADWPRARDGG
jgi:hypothetical protein